MVFEDERTLAFLDNRPLFPGHSLLVPRDHYETLADLPDELVGPLFANARLLSVAVPKAMKKPGSFVALNNVVSQSVPTCTSTSSRASRRTGCAASSGRGRNTTRRMRCARSPSGCAGPSTELLELRLAVAGEPNGISAVTVTLAVLLLAELALAGLAQLHASTV